MSKFFEIFHCKLYDKETIMNWKLPEKIKEQLGIDQFDFFFLTTSKEDSHEGHKHIHLSIFPTKYDVINLLEVEIPVIDPNLLNEILEAVTQCKFDIVTSAGYCKEQNNCYFGIFFSKPLESNTKDLISEVKKIENVLGVKVFNYTCDGCCEE